MENREEGGFRVGIDRDGGANWIRGVLESNKEE